MTVNLICRRGNSYRMAKHNLCTEGSMKRGPMYSDKITFRPERSGLGADSIVGDCL